MEDKIILKFKTKNILNFYEIEPRSIFWSTTSEYSKVPLFAHVPWSSCLCASEVA